MGLDQYAYIADKAGQQNEWYENSVWNEVTREYENHINSKPQEIAYWRKHPNLQGWMEQLWMEKGGVAPETDPTFNGVELELTWDDLDRLEQDVQHKRLPQTRGFFFGDDSDDYYRERDLEFIKTAKAEVFLGRRVFYNSSW
jgi:hypothetical protein